MSAENRVLFVKDLLELLPDLEAQLSAQTPTSSPSSSQASEDDSPLGVSVNRLPGMPKPKSSPRKSVTAKKGRPVRKSIKTAKGAVVAAEIAAKKAGLMEKKRLARKLAVSSSSDYIPTRSSSPDFPPPAGPSSRAVVTSPAFDSIYPTSPQFTTPASHADATRSAGPSAASSRAVYARSRGLYSDSSSSSCPSSQRIPFWGSSEHFVSSPGKVESGTEVFSSPVKEEPVPDIDVFDDDFTRPMTVFLENLRAARLANLEKKPPVIERKRKKGPVVREGSVLVLDSDDEVAPVRPLKKTVKKRTPIPADAEIIDLCDSDEPVAGPSGVERD